MSQEILEEVPLDEINSILDIFKKNFERHYPLNQYIAIYKEYKDGNVEEPRQILLRYGDVEEGVYIVKTIFCNVDTSYINFFIYSASDDISNVRKVLSQTSQIPWYTRGFSIQAVFKNIAPIIHEVAGSKGVDLKCVDDLMMWIISREYVTEGEVPEYLELKYLCSTHVQEICENWPNKFPGCEFYLGQQIKNNFGLGLFKKADNKMVSSAISFHSGGIFVLSTHPDFRGKGYAEVVVRNMVKELFQRERIPFALIRKGNIPSQNLFKKIGFKEFGEVEHIFPKDFR